jgi:branched-chain amino acid transport system ATP-binding protein
MAEIRVHRLRKEFADFTAVQDSTFTVRDGEFFCLLGPSGCGKTTTLRMIAGLELPTSGQIFLGDEDVTRLPPAQRVKRGLARTFQINSQFRSLTVLDNVCLAMAEQADLGHCWWRGRYLAHVIEASLALLRQLDLWRHADTIVGELPYGRQRILEIAMALALKPSVLLLDEPAAGVPSSETRVVLEVVEGLAPDIAVLLIEHDMGVVFRVAREITVLVQGAILMTGAPEMVEQDARVREIYLGKRRA